MKACKKCGEEVTDAATVCPQCGVADPLQPGSAPRPFTKDEALAWFAEHDRRADQQRAIWAAEGDPDAILISGISDVPPGVFVKGYALSSFAGDRTAAEGSKSVDQSGERNVVAPITEIREDLEAPEMGLSRFRPTSLSEWVFVIFFGVCVITLGGMVVTALMGGGGGCAGWERAARLC